MKIITAQCHQKVFEFLASNNEERIKNGVGVGFLL
jgi:hypothetical protein